MFLFFYLTLLIGKVLRKSPESLELESSIIYGS
jgi:hypothetical protein